ncbi:MAG: AsmA-like C-terminal region-containing protein [Pseudomonadota bacterium]
MILLPVCLLLLIAAGMLYARLSQGPLSLPFIAKAIGKGLSEELGGTATSVATAELAAQNGGLSLLLRDVRIHDPDRRPVIVAPRVSVALNLSALWQARLVPQRVTLIAPRLRLRRSRGGELLLSVSNRESVAATQSSDNTKEIASRVADVAAAPVAPLNVASVLRELLTTVRTSAYGKSLAVENATVVLDRENKRSVEFALPRADLQLEGVDRPTLVARAVVAKARGTTNVVVRIAALPRGESFRINVDADGIDPSMLSVVAADRSVRDVLDGSVRASANVIVTDDGKLQGGRVTAEFQGASLAAAGQQFGRVAVEAARFQFDLAPEFERVDMAPSWIRTSLGDLTLVGVFTPGAADANGAEAQADWTFRIRAAEGWLKAIGRTDPQVEANRTPIKTLLVEGRVGPNGDHIGIGRAEIAVGDTSLKFAGQVGLRRQPDVRLNGQIAGVAVTQVAELWPAGLMPEAKAWFVANVKSASAADGTFSIDTRGRSGDYGTALAVRLRARDVQFSPVAGLPFVSLPAVTISFAGGSAEVLASTGTMIVPGKGTTKLSDLRYTVAGALTSDPRAEAAFRWAGPLPAALALLASPQLDVVPPEFARRRTKGWTTGQLTLALPPPGVADWTRETQITGTARVSDGEWQGVALPYPVKSASLALTFSPKVMDLNGRVLIAGVPATVTWQRIHSALDTEQPPLRIRATLDGTDRRQLGVGNGAIVRRGDTPVEITVRKSAKGQDVHVDVDLTNAELAVESLSWVKPRGIRSILQFDVEKGRQYKTRLTNLKVVGPGLAVQGWAELNTKNELATVELPTFSIDGSRLSLKAKRRDVGDGKTKQRGTPVWNVAVNGSFYDGSKFFRGLFSVPSAASGAATPQLGLDLTATIGSVKGFNDARLKSVKVTLSKRNGKLTALKANGVLDGGGKLNAVIRNTANQPRRLIATSTDAGNVFRMVNFYNRARGGDMRLVVEMDGSGDAQRTGVLRVRNFQVLGDPVISEVIQTGEDDRLVVKSRKGKPGQNVTREVVEFDLMHAPFSVGYGQLVLRDAQLRGPLFGASLRGKADFARRTVQLGGTYAPLQGLFAAFRVLPGIGPLLTGPRGEGVVGLTFAVQGPMDEPEVLVNPLSLAAPGIFREIFQMSPLDPRVRRRGDDGASPPTRRRPAISATPPKRSGSATGQPSTDAPPRPSQRVPGTVIGDWKSMTREPADPTAIFNQN